MCSNLTSSAAWSAAANFDAVNNPTSSGWSYGYSQSLDGTFALFNLPGGGSSMPSWRLSGQDYPDVTYMPTVFTSYGGYAPAGSLTLTDEAGEYGIVRWTAPWMCILSPRGLMSLTAKSRGRVRSRSLPLSVWLGARRSSSGLGKVPMTLASTEPSWTHKSRRCLNREPGWEAAWGYRRPCGSLAVNKYDPRSVKNCRRGKKAISYQSPSAVAASLS